MNENNTAPVENMGGDLGVLQVNAFLGGVARPAENALVRVSDPDTGRVLEEVRTDAAGRAPALTLPAPPLANSMTAGGQRPFNQYDVTLAFPDYQDALVENVQLYPRCTAVQNVTLAPRFPEIVIPYPVLWGDYPPKIPEAEVKKLPFPGNLAVLPEPAVPGLVVVHAGVPDDASAPNYTVSFPDYVKNVASSEIYATWPAETLRANILAIVSFTLNRVYTEWYRGKGYDFTVTNSTAYDQSFTYGRTIYREISDVVDEVFSTYISKADILQPLFTQYCDGREVQRDGWLSQWGSKDLGDQGYSALQILKNYYGYEIVLKQAKKVEGIPLSFPGAVLRLGSAGSAVETIQRQLNGVAKNYPLIPRTAEDGVYGEKTAEAVRVFQQTFGLPVTGEGNFPTWYRISDVYVAVSKLA